MAMIQFRMTGQTMNNRLFLYSGLFLVLILLYDAWDNRNAQNTVTQENIPDTIIEQDKSQANPPKDSVRSNVSELPDNDSAQAETILITTDTLEVKVSLTDGSVVSAKLLKYPEVFGLSLIHI